MFSSKKDKARLAMEQDELDEDDELEDETAEEPSDVPSSASVTGAPSEEDAEDAGDEDEEEIEEDHNDAEDEEERYLLSLARRQKWKKYTALIIAGVVIVALLTNLIVRAATHVDPTKTAAKVANTEITLSEFAFNYFYGVDYCANQYKSYGIDLSGDLKTTACAFDTSITWHEYFVKSACELLQQNVALFEEAKKAGYEVTDEDNTMVENYLSSMTSYAEQYGVTLDAFIKSCYGEYVDEATLVASLLRMSIANRYRSDYAKNIEISDADIEAYFEENKATYETVNYRMMIFSDASLDEGEERTAQEVADAMAAEVKDEKSFVSLAKEYAPESVKSNYDNENYTLAQNITESNFSSEEAAKEWLFDDARKSGDVTVLELQSGYAVTYFISRDRDRTQTVDIRHILIQPESEDDAADKAAQEEAERIYAEWKNGEATAESFGALAKEYTADSNGDQGGLYEKVTPGQMVQEFNDWCFDSARKPGDSGIVKTKYGYHIMYFVERNEENWSMSIRSILQSSKYSTYFSELLDQYPYSVFDNVVAHLSR